MIKEEYKENKQEDKLDKLIEIECILRGVSKEVLLREVLSEKAYKLYNVLR